MALRVEILSRCPLCDAETCLEYDFTVPALSRLHCRSQHAHPAPPVPCEFTKDLDLPPSPDGYVFVDPGWTELQ